MKTKEKQIEESLIEKLISLKYTYRPDIKDKLTLEQNFRQKFEELHKVNLADSEFSRLKDEIVTSDVFTAANTLRSTNLFFRDDGTPFHYTLVNTKNWCKNDFEVIHQLRINTDNSYQRYDVILLINGIPVVQIELKALEVSPRKAMEQIVEYKSAHGNGFENTLLCFMQIFIVSNRSNTYYFVNNNRKHFAFNADERFLPVYQWANEENYKITHLDDFSNLFLAKCTLAEMISRYMVIIANEKKLLMMRPYQIYAVKAIIDCIKQNRGNGYIWHTTGSGKTLTSFKASTLLKDNPNIDKCLFVVDRKDLDRQTREEFNKFQEGCVEENTNTETLVQRLLSDDFTNKVIVTTIQKLSIALSENSRSNKFNNKTEKISYKERLEPLRDKRIVFIFDECHRSQFGENHQTIKEFFPNSQLFGFTGTPIFAENAIYTKREGQEASLLTTKDIFEKELHAYTITNAIDDRNVLKFCIDYFKLEDTKNPKRKVQIGSDQAKEAIVKVILNKHNQATNLKRFNAILATASINDAIEYYQLFKNLQKDIVESDLLLNVVAVFSPPAYGNRDIQQLQEDLPHEVEDNKHDPEGKKAALIEIISDYNNKYSTNHKIEEFDFYYQDVQKRIKSQEYPIQDVPRKDKIDIVIVVDMLLTGFDSKFLNTLYVDKNLKYHGLIQAFSRTNRVLNDTKPNGNILEFRQQQAAVDDAIKLFSGQHKNQAKEIWLVEPAAEVIKKYDKAISGLERFMNSQGLTFTASDVNNLKGDTACSEFINQFKEIQRLKTQLDQYTNLTTEQEQIIQDLFPTEQLSEFKASYLETAQKLRNKQLKKDAVISEEVRNTDFEFVLFSSAIVDYDYIMKLVSNLMNDNTSKHKMLREELMGYLETTSNLMGEREDMKEYINTLKTGEALSIDAIKQGYMLFKEQKFSRKLKEISKDYGLNAKELETFVAQILDRMIFDAEQLSELLAPLDLGWRERSQKELALMEKLVPLLKHQTQGREISGLEVYE
ncbi:type I restriction endonuclease subunit R [Pigmentibacter ruber]